jgi:hypothetical protein
LACSAISEVMSVTVVQLACRIQSHSLGCFHVKLWLVLFTWSLCVGPYTDIYTYINNLLYDSDVCLFQYIRNMTRYFQALIFDVFPYTVIKY